MGVKRTFHFGEFIQCRDVRGVSENIIEASWLALVDSLEYKLFKDEDKGA